MILGKDNSFVKKFQMIFLNDKDFLKNLMAESLQSILQAVIDPLLSILNAVLIPG